MTDRAIYIWKLQPIINAEGSVPKIIEKARRARLSQLWVKIADGAQKYANVTGATGNRFADLIQRAHAANIQVWGWHVPYCETTADVNAEVAVVSGLVQQFPLDGLIMDAEGGAEFFRGDATRADQYGDAMRTLANANNIPLAISSNDIPQNIGGWLPRFNKIAAHATVNFPQVYYGGSPSVEHRLDRAVAGNAHVTIPFCPVGAAWIGDGGGCASASASAERARQFIRLVHDRGYPSYSFWHWAGAPMAFWEVLNTTSP
ncbi:hypothetical protein [Bosea sp. 117]|uniref:hypothetical protein n=1 Tax=Bosea sp. 117 TaxID=1125973 RepID=UPI0004946E8E|nr:hypothetical protein [Bosea sp. 117]